MNSELNFEKNNYVDREDSIEYIRKIHGINFDLSNHKIPKKFHEDFEKLAQENRIVAGHSLNEVSSRSHCLITMTVIQRSIDGTLKTSKLNLIMRTTV